MKTRNIKRATPTDVKIGQRVRALRRTKELSQTDLAKQLGVAFQQVQKYEKGANRIPSSRLERIAKVLDVNVGYFFDGGDGTPATHERNMIDEMIADHFGAKLAGAFVRMKDHKMREYVAGFVDTLSRSAEKHASK